MNGKINWGNKYLDILILAIIISVSVAIVVGMGPAITGFYATAGNEWEGRIQVEAVNSEQAIATHVLFGANKPSHCSDGIYVEAADGQQISFKAENEVYLNGVCEETDVSFNNIIYGQDAPPITYLAYYGKILETKSVFGAAMAFGAMATTVGSCANLTTANELYNLNVSLIDSDVLTCFSINATNVTFNGNNLTIDGTKFINSFGINISAANVTIANVTITQWDGGGITAASSVNLKIQNVTIHDMSSGGILLGANTQNATLNYVNISNLPGRGLDVISNGMTIANSTISSTRGEAIYLLTATGAVIENSIISNGTTRGLEINGGNNHIVRHSIFVNNSRGIRLSSGATRNELYNLTIENNTYGIEIIDANSAGNFSNITLQNNRIADFISTSTAFIPLLNITISFNFTFSATAFNVSIRNATVASIAADPASFRNMSKYLNITNNSAGAWIFLNISYNEAEIPAGFLENTIGIFKYNGTSWETDKSLFSSSFATDAVNNVVTANITNFYGNITGQTIFALFAENDTTLPVPTFVSPTPANASTVNVNSFGINVTATDTNLANITIVLSNSSGIVNTSVSTASPFFLNFTNLAEDVNYTVNATALDSAGNSNFTARVFVINTGDAVAQAAVTSTSSSGTGGGVGSAGTIGETSATVVIGDVSAGERKAVFFEGSASVSKVAFETLLSAKGISVTAGGLQALPQSIVPLPAGYVLYNYLSIKISGTPEPAVANGEITFSVDKAWLQKNNVDKSSVVLLRYANQNWQSLLTRAVSEDSTNNYYSSETPGFSVFAIVGKEQSVVAPAVVIKTTEVKAIEVPKTSTALFNLPKLNFGLPKFVVSFSKKAAFLLTPSVLLAAALLTIAVIVLARFAPKFLKERAARRAIEARKPKTLKLVHDATHYRQARVAGDIAQDLSDDISSLERALKKLK